MDYIFGSTTRDGVTTETLLTVGEAHSALTGETETRRTFPEGDLIDHFRIVERCRSAEDGEGRCYDWYTIEGHYRYVDKTAAVQALSEFIARAALNVYFKFEKGSTDMMAMLFAQRVILGKTEFNQVPAKLKRQVADILIDECGLPELVPTEYGGTAEAAE